nr:hypothetical protein [Candidatus Sigynarchaeota archaeon]
MTTKVHQQHEEHLLGFWDAFVAKVIEERPDCLMIVGNLFSTPRPRNKTLQIVVESMQRLTGAGITVFIYPGSKDTPLFHANDAFPHYLLGSVKGVHVLAKETPDISNHVSEPVFAGTIGDTQIQIFTPPSPLVQLADIDCKFKANNNGISFFLLNGRIIGDEENDKNADKAIRLDKAGIAKLTKAGINCIFLGGCNDKFTSQKGYSKIVTCPPLFPTDFAHEESPTGMVIVELDSKAGIKEPVWVHLGYYPIKQVTFNVMHEQASEINETVTEIIRRDSARNAMFQICLTGDLPRQEYHAIKIHEFVELGNRRNFYFELVDEIGFEEKTMDVSGLHPVVETEKLVHKLECENADEKPILEKSLAMIKADWEKLD